MSLSDSEVLSVPSNLRQCLCEPDFETQVITARRGGTINAQLIQSP
jgi:hypothetical protein